MKRILRIRLTLCMCGLSVFFTGCNQKEINSYIEFSVPNETGVGPVEKPTEAPRKEGGPKDVDQTVKAETDKVLEARFEDLTGTRAFYFPENHLDGTSDLKAFEILGLVEDYFYYYYVTTDTQTGQEVHVVARNHKSDENRHDILYQRQVEIGEDSSGVYSPFYVHMCTDVNGEYKISIYENGDLSLIDREGNVRFNRGSGKIQFGSEELSGGESLLDLIDEIFGVGGENPSYFDRDITSVTTDGRYNFYIPVTLTVEDYTALEIDPDQEEETLTTETYLLGYSYMPIGNGGSSEYLLRYNINYWNQVMYWRELAEGASSERDAEADWEKTKKVYPDRFGYYKVASGENLSITEHGDLYQWKNQDVRKFLENKKVGDIEAIFTQVDQSAIEPAFNLTDGQRLERYFFQDQEKGYCPIVGSVKKNSRTEVEAQATRSYTVVTGEGNDRTEETFTEYVNPVYAEKLQFQDGSAIERFVVLDNRPNIYITPGTVDKGRYSMGICMANICSLQCFAESSAQIESQRYILFEGAGEEMGAYILNSLGDQPYVLGTDLEHKRLLINTPSKRWITLMTSDLNPLGYRQSDEDKTLLDEMKKQSERIGGYDASGADIHRNPDQYSRQNVLILEDGSNIKVLFSTFFNGMQLFEGSTEESGRMGQSSSGTIYRLADYPVYQAWRTGDNQITAVGFNRTDADYQYMDIARARVYEFDLDTLLEDAPSRGIPSNEEPPGETVPRDIPVPENMQQYWGEVRDEREKKPEPTKTDKLPDVTIYETNPNMGKAWEAAQEEKESESSAE